METLEHLYRHLAQVTTTDLSGNSATTFTVQTLPLPPQSLVTDRIHIRKARHDYGGYYLADSLWIQAEKEVYRQWGLLILATLFHPDQPSVTLQLTHPTSDIKRIRMLNPTSVEPTAPGYHTRPYAFTYYAEEPRRPLWQYPHPSVWDLPSFHLTTENEMPITDADWRERDTIVGFGGDVACVRLAELLLNIGIAENTAVEYVLEGDGGYRAVGIHSVEIRFFLPGSLGWDSLW